MNSILIYVGFLRHFNSTFLQPILLARCGRRGGSSTSRFSLLRMAVKRVSEGARRSSRLENFRFQKAPDLNQQLPFPHLHQHHFKSFSRPSRPARCPAACGSCPEARFAFQTARGARDRSRHADEVRAGTRGSSCKRVNRMGQEDGCEIFVCLFCCFFAMECSKPRERPRIRSLRALISDEMNQSSQNRQGKRDSAHFS